MAAPWPGWERRTASLQLPACVRAADAQMGRRERSHARPPVKQRSCYRPTRSQTRIDPGRGGAGLERHVAMYVLVVEVARGRRAGGVERLRHVRTHPDEIAGLHLRPRLAQVVEALAL